MRSHKSTGRIIGLILLTQLILGLTTQYIILLHLNAPLTSAGYEPLNAFLVRVAVMMLFVGDAVSVAIAVVAWPILRQFSYPIALWVVVLGVVNLSLQCVENAAWMSMFTC